MAKQLYPTDKRDENGRPVLSHRNYGRRITLTPDGTVECVDDPGEVTYLAPGSQRDNAKPDLIVIPSIQGSARQRQGFLNAQRAKDAMMWFMLGAGSVWMAFTTTMLFI